MGKLYNLYQKQGGSQLLKDYWRSGVLFYACSQIVLTGFSKKSLELMRNGVELKKYQKAKKKYHAVLELFDGAYRKSDKPMAHSKKVWVCWMQGIENAPELVKRCYRSLQENLTDREIVLITSENLKEYTDFPQYILEKYEKGLITHTHFSDLLRVELLCRYGGTWIDATVFCSGGTIPAYMLDADLFMFQNLKPGADGSVLNISSWFMTSCANNKILLAVKDLLWKYWEKEDRLMDYFLVHHFIMMAREYYAEDWDKMVQFPNSFPHVLLLMVFEPFDQEKWEAVTEVCPFHKLSYKGDKVEMERSDTYYQYLMHS